jgi:hypothetical protein
MKNRISPFQIMVARARDAFRKNRIDPDEKILATLLYHLGLSYRRVSNAWENLFSHESVRKWYRKVGSVLPIQKMV